MASKRPGDDSSNPAGAGKKKQTQPQAQAASSVSGAVAVPAPRLSAAAASCSATPLLARLLADCDTGSASPLLERLLADCDSSLEDAFARLTVSLRQPLLGLLCGILFKTLKTLMSCRIVTHVLSPYREPHAISNTLIRQLLDF